MSDDQLFPRDERAKRLQVGSHARELVRAAVHHDMLAFIQLADEVVIESFAGIEVPPEAESVTGPSYLQAYLAYVMRVSAAMIREALGGDDRAIEDLLTRVCTALEIGDLSD